MAQVRHILTYDDEARLHSQERALDKLLAKGYTVVNVYYAPSSDENYASQTYILNEPSKTEPSRRKLFFT